MRSTEISPSGSESISSRIFWAAVSVTVTIRVSVYQRVSAGKGPRLCDSCSTRNFSIRSRVRDTARKTPPRLVWRRDARRPGRLVSVPRLRLLRPCDPGVDDPDVVRLRDPAVSPRTRANRPLRVRGFHRTTEAAALHDQLLPDGDALHRLRHRDRLSLSRRRHPRAGALVRGGRVRLLHRHPRGRLRVRLEERSARVAEVERKKRLADYGLHSERLLMRRKEPGVFERELGDLEDKLMLTTVSARYDVARFGAEVFRSSPRQADLLIVSGRVAHKMAKPLRQIYDQML